MPKRDLGVESLRQERQWVQRQLADLFKEQLDWYEKWVKPNAGEAMMLTPGGKLAGQTRPLSIEAAEKLDTETATGRFERGRAHVEHLSTRIRHLKTREARLTKEIGGVRRAGRIDWAARLERYAHEFLSARSPLVG